MDKIKILHKEYTEEQLRAALLNFYSIKDELQINMHFSRLTGLSMSQVSRLEKDYKIEIMVNAGLRKVK